MWKILVRIGLDYVQRHLLNRLNASPLLQAFITRVLLMIDLVVERVTDSDPNNAAQLKKLMADNYEELLVLLLSGVADQIKDSEAKRRVVAILADAIERLQSPAGPTSTPGVPVADS